MLLCAQRAVCFEDELEGFFEIAARLNQRSALGIGAGDFFDVGDIPAPALLDDGSKFAAHSNSYPSTLRDRLASRMREVVIAALS